MPIVTETLANLADNDYQQGSEIRVAIFDADPNTGDEIVSTAVADHIFVRCQYPVSRDDGRSVADRHSGWTKLADANFASFSAGDSAATRALLKKIFDDLRP